MNATPTLRSSSCLASTARASHRFGAPRRDMASSTLRLVTALNLARWTRELVRGMERAHASITSKHMFSPSRSQSSQRMRSEHPRDSRSRCSTTRAPGLASSFVTGAANRARGSTSQLWNRGGKSIVRTWPRTAVTRKSHAAPRKRRVNSCTSGPLPRRVRWVPSERKAAMDAASEGFSATHSTVGGMAGGARGGGDAARRGTSPDRAPRAEDRPRTAPRAMDLRARGCCFREQADGRRRGIVWRALTRGCSAREPRSPSAIPPARLFAALARSRGARSRRTIRTRARRVRSRTDAVSPRAAPSRPSTRSHSPLDRAARGRPIRARSNRTLGRTRPRRSSRGRAPSLSRLRDGARDAREVHQGGV